MAVALTRNETRGQRVPNTVGRAADIFGMLATARGAPICDISRAMTWTAPERGVKALVLGPLLLAESDAG